MELKNCPTYGASPYAQLGAKETARRCWRCWRRRQCPASRQASALAMRA